MATIPPMEVQIVQMEPGLQFTPQGLTLGEFAAVMAMSGLLSSNTRGKHTEFAKNAIDCADALIAALNQPGGSDAQ